MVLALSLKSMFRSFGILERRLWTQSVCMGIGSSAVARRTRLASPEEAFVAGLLADSGQAVLLELLRGDYQGLLLTAYREDVDILELEREHFGVGHDEIGARWRGAGTSPRASSRPSGNTTGAPRVRPTPAPAGWRTSSRRPCCSRAQWARGVRPRRQAIQTPSRRKWVPWASTPAHSTCWPKRSARASSKRVRCLAERLATSPLARLGNSLPRAARDPVAHEPGRVDWWRKRGATWVASRVLRSRRGGPNAGRVGFFRLGPSGFAGDSEMSQAISGIGNPASPSSPPPMTAPSDLPATESTLTTTGNILVIDDEALVLSAVGRALEREGFAVTTGASLADCRDRLREQAFDVLLLDQVLPDGDGSVAAGELAREDLAPAIVVMTGQGSVAKAVEAMRNGAFDYVTKPFGIPDLTMRLRRAIEHRSLVRRMRVAERQDRRGRRAESEWLSPRMLELEALARRYAASDAPILVLGETGVGKDRLARLIHRWSQRSNEGFVTLDCAGLAPTLLQSELFGHERGSFTGAEGRREGFELAHHGTLFMDEIGELAPEVQAIFLRALESKRFRRVGGNRELTSDFRLVAATNRNLEEASQNGKFRADLFYRINTLVLVIPPLRERLEDMPILVRQLVASSGGDDHPIADEVLAALHSYDWPGNIRELRNVVERARILSGDGPIRIEHLLLPGARRIETTIAASAHGFAATSVTPPPAAQPASQLIPAVPPPPAPIAARSDNPFPTLDELERAHIREALARTQGNKAAAARILGTSLTTLKRRLKELGQAEAGGDATDSGDDDSDEG
ncbi:MAG: sigma 54-interacting transcriptional regulator [Deltaproteobacteria bacterium]|nr:sigma 54-interacting transcriptional regulator [Deltaproteobacteria bacterium]